MNQEKWEIIKRCAAGEELDSIPVAVLIDSPWLPGYLGVSTIDYLMMPDVWLKANLKFEAEFPDIISLPGFWVEWGMAAEPSGFGCQVSFFDNRPPNILPVLSVDAVVEMKQPDPKTAGVMPLILNFYKHVQPRIKDAGYAIKVAAARGPFATAGHIIGITEFFMGMKKNPKAMHKLLKKTTQLTIDWLEAQTDVLSDVEGIMVLDDIVGFVSEKDFLEFGHPYFKQIFDTFPNTIKMFHNDMENKSAFKYLREWPVHIFNFSHLFDIAEVRELVGPDVCLMGNVPPLEVLRNGTPQEVLDSAMGCIDRHPGSAGLLLSAGGAVSGGTPVENMRMLSEAVRNREL